MYEILHHTADIRIRVTATSLEGLFADALHALMAVMSPVTQQPSNPVTPSPVTQQPSNPVTPSDEPIQLHSSDPTALLIDFLNEVLVRAVVRRHAYSGVSFASLGATHLDGTLSGVPVESFGEDVKAVTYHEAEVRRGEGGWTTMLVLDI